MARCRTCKAEILWVRMPSGKLMPVDAQPKTMIEVEHGSAGGEPHGKTIQAHESHFATCPDAAEHRKDS